MAQSWEMQKCQNVVRQEEAKQVAEGTGEDWCHPSAYNKETASYAVSQ